MDYLNSHNATERSLGRSSSRAVTVKAPNMSAGLLRDTGKMIERSDTWHLSPDSKQAFVASLFKAIGTDVPAPHVAESGQPLS